MNADLAAIPGYRRTSALGGLAAFLLAVLFLAGAVHICAILLVPTFARQDGWSRLAKFAGEGRFLEVRAVGPQAADAAGLDPLFVTGACRLNLGEAPVAITLAARERFWSLALYEPKGTIIFSLNDRTAVEGRLDMLVVNPAQNNLLRQQAPAASDQSIVVESRSDDLVALVRLFAPTSAAQTEARRIIGAAECVAEALEE
jgi:uncharacterized membrane protein